MRLSSLCVAGLSLVGSGSALHRRQDGPIEGADGTEAVKNRYIFEFDQAVDTDATTEKLGEQLHGSTVRKTFDSDVFKGASLDTLDDVDVLEALGQLEGVINIWPAHRVQLSQPKRVDLPEPSEVGAGDYNVHHMTGVDKLHAAGVLGKGAVIAIVDSGIDYTHPAVSCPTKTHTSGTTILIFPNTARRRLRARLQGRRWLGLCRRRQLARIR